MASKAAIIAVAGNAAALRLCQSMGMQVQKAEDGRGDGSYNGVERKNGRELDHLELSFLKMLLRFGNLFYFCSGK